MKKEIISVLLSVYNREVYLDRCIRSVLDQKDVNVELIIVDDGSTDGSSRICDDYGDKYDNILVIHQENAGISVARNVALDYAKGDYIAFLDSDDYLPEDALSTLLALAKENDADMTFGNYAEYSDEGEYLKSFPIPERYCNKLLTNRETCELLQFSGDTHVLMVSWGKIYKREIWDGVRFPPKIVKSEDQYIFPELMERCKKIYFTDKIVYNQCFSTKSITRSIISRKHLFHTEGVSIVTDYLLKQGYFDLALYKYGVGSRSILDFMGALKDEESVKEIRRLCSVYSNLAKRLMPHVDTKNKLRLALFMFDVRLYKLVQRKYAEKYKNKQ